MCGKTIQQIIHVANHDTSGAQLFEKGSRRNLNFELLTVNEQIGTSHIVSIQRIIHVANHDTSGACVEINTFDTKCKIAPTVSVDVDQNNQCISAACNSTQSSGSLTNDHPADKQF